MIDNKSEFLKYKAIYAWGRMMGSDLGYIRMQQRMALADNAPIDAIYKRDKWVRLSEVENPRTIQYFEIKFTELYNEFLKK